MTDTEHETDRIDAEADALVETMERGEDNTQPDAE